MSCGALIERESDRACLETALGQAVEGHGSLVLVSGEAGVGKTRFVEAIASCADMQLLRGASSPGSPAYGPVLSALRESMRIAPGALSGSLPLRGHLALLLPELGQAVEESDRVTLFEAIRSGLAAVAAVRPAVVLLDDLQWSDEATLDLLAGLAGPLREMPVLLVGIYRSDEVPRSHQLTRLRDDLRRNHSLCELRLEPLSAAGTAELAAHVLGAEPSPQLAAALHDRTGGLPFFVEELAAALLCGERDLDEDVPLPETIRDAVLLRAADLSGTARETAEAVSVAGARFDVDLVAELGWEAGLDELLARGLIVEGEPGQAAFRHPLVRDAIYEDIPWLRRRSLHRRLATALGHREGRQAEVAEHWLAAHDEERALEALLRAVDERAAVHAHRDAARLGGQALDLWPEGERGLERIALLERHARFAELSGDLAEAGRAQREVVAARRNEGAGRALADAERRLAAIYELEGDRTRALTARRVAADAYAAHGLHGDAASERLLAAGYLHSAGHYAEALTLMEQAAEEAARAARTDLRARVLGMQGVMRVKTGEYEAGMETIRAGLSLALEHELTADAAELYQRLGTGYEIAGDYGSARDALATALSFCETGGVDGLARGCVSCMVYVLRELGDWDRAVEMAQELRAVGAELSVMVVLDGMLGSILAFRGDLAGARPLLAASLEVAARLPVLSMNVDSAAALAGLDEAEGDLDQARAHARIVLERWSQTEDHHYSVWGLRWVAGFFARHGDLAEARACADALSHIATRTGHPDALAALAHALGEIAFAEGHPAAAAQQLLRAVELHSGLCIPFERAQIQLRAGVMLGAAGQREAALEQLGEAYRGAQRLGAQPLAAAAAAEVAKLGESVELRLGRRAAADYENAGLSRRELEVMRSLAAGATNREIAGTLVLSTRTVDMHVRNILTKLRVRSRTEAAAKASELGLLA